jgi:hypothetical protein
LNIVNLISLGACAASAAFLIRGRRATVNLNAIRLWTDEMDVTVDENRYRGKDAKQLFKFFARREGIFCVASKHLYLSKTGQYFELEVVAELGRVSRWVLTPVSDSDASLFLSYVRDEDLRAISAPEP